MNSRLTLHHPQGIHPDIARSAHIGDDPVHPGHAVVPAGIRSHDRCAKCSMAVWDQSRSPESRALLDAFRAADYFPHCIRCRFEAELQDLIERGEARAALIIPPDYSQRLLEGDAQVAMVLDGSDSTVGGTALSTARLIGQSHATKLMQEQAARSGRSAEFNPPLEVRTQVWYNPDLISAHFMIPGVIGMILFAITSILTATTIVRERERGTIEQLIVTPIRSWELMVGKLIPYVILSLFDTWWCWRLGIFG